MATIPSDVTIGTPTRASQFNTVVDTLAEINAITDSILSSTLANPSFELDLDLDDIPDGWDFAAAGGATYTLIDTESRGGNKCMEFSMLANSTVSMSNSNYLIGGIQQIDLSSWVRSSIAGIPMTIKIHEYDEDFVSLGLTDIWSGDAPDDATDWKCLYTNYGTTGKYFKIRIDIGSLTGGAIGTVLIDDCQLKIKNSIITVPSFTAGTSFDDNGGDEIVATGWAFVPAGSVQATVSYWVNDYTGSPGWGTRIDGSILIASKTITSRGADSDTFTISSSTSDRWVQVDFYIMTPVTGDSAIVSWTPEGIVRTGSDVTGFISPGWSA